MIDIQQRDQIRARTDTLLAQHGYNVGGRIDIVVALVDEFGISEDSAIQYISARKRHWRGGKKKGDAA